MTDAQAVLHAFTCYSRSEVNEVTGGNRLLEERLRAELLRPVSIYHDRNPETGQKGGDWLRAIATEIARASLFFWWQTPEWFTKRVCRWELDCFRARVGDIERLLAAPAGSLTFLLVEPIPLDEVSPDRWPELSVEPDLRDFYEKLERQAVFLDPLRARSAPPFAEATYRQAARQLRIQLGEALAHHGGLNALVAVPPSGAGFVDYWLGEAQRRGLVGGEPAASMAPPRAGTGGHGRRAGRSLARAGDERGGFLVTARVERGDDLGPPPTGRDHVGRACWDAWGADEMDDDARPLGLRLPTRAEAERIQALIAAPAEERRRRGLEERAAAFWFRDDGSDLPRSTTGSDAASVYLIADEDA